VSLVRTLTFGALRARAAFECGCLVCYRVAEGLASTATVATLTLGVVTPASAVTY
jgi:hypothetical protein